MKALNHKIIQEIENAGFGFALARNRSEAENRIIISAETWDEVGDKGVAADYYGEFRGGLPWIAPELVEIASRHDAYWEWENPGAIALYAA